MKTKGIKGLRKHSIQEIQKTTDDIKYVMIYIKRKNQKFYEDKIFKDINELLDFIKNNKIKYFSVKTYINNNKKHITYVI